MPESTDLRQLAASVNAVRGGLTEVLDEPSRRHRPETWTSRSAELARTRLHSSHLAALEQADGELASAALQLSRRAAALEAAEAAG